MQTKETKLCSQLLSANELAKVLSLSKRQIFRLNSSHKIPKPIHIGGSIRWAENTISDWLAVGAPDRKTFESLKSERGEIC